MENLKVKWHKHSQSQFDRIATWYSCNMGAKAAMNFSEDVRELADERSLTFFKLSQICDVSHSTLKNSERRGGQLSVDTIERICDGLGITMSEFFARKG